VESHGFISNPKPRQYRDETANWVGIVIPGDGAITMGSGDAPNLNAGIGGGPNGAAMEKQIGHGLCGDLATRRAFEVGPYGATAPRATIPPGGVLSMDIALTAYHAGWFEFRLCAPGPSGVLTQECLNEHVLEIDPSTPYFPDVINYSGMQGISKGGDGGWYKCANSGGFNDPTSSTPNTFWPNGSCCSNGGACSDPMQNKDRYVVEFAAGGGSQMYKVNLRIPEDVTCDNCVVQWFYQTANSRDNYPEGFWNCVDVAVSGNIVQPKPTPQPQSTPTSSPTTTPPTPNGTGDDNNNDGCGSCSNGCWWADHSPDVACYKDWTPQSCANQQGNYKWCGDLAPTTETTTPPTPADTAPPTPITAPPTTAATGDNNPAGCGTCSNGCWWTATTSQIGCYKWSQATCASQGSAYVWCS